MPSFLDKVEIDPYLLGTHTFPRISTMCSVMRPMYSIYEFSVIADLVFVLIFVTITATIVYLPNVNEIVIRCIFGVVHEPNIVMSFTCTSPALNKQTS